MEENSKIQDEASEELKDVETEWISSSEYIAAAYNALSAVESLNVMTPADTKRKKEIIRKAFRIIENRIDKLYQSLGEDEDE